MSKKQLETFIQVNNDAADAISGLTPYSMLVVVRGDAPLLLHRYSPESVDLKGKAAKGSATKKTDDLQSYVYRNEKNQICLPGEYLRGALVTAAKSKQDPRSPRKSAMDLCKAGIICSTILAPLNGGVTDWDYLDARRVVVQRSAITRQRPAFNTGWQCEFQLDVLTPEYIDKAMLSDLLTNAGRLIGLADFRPTYGRFHVEKFEEIVLR